MKKYINASLIGVFSVVLGLIQACDQKTEQVIDDLSKKTEKPESIMAYYTAFTQAADGKFMLKSHTTHASQDFDGSNIIDGFFLDKNNKSVAGGDVTIGNITLKANIKNNNCYCSDRLDWYAGKNLHGNTIKVLVNPPTGGSNLRTSSTDTVSTQVYVPTLVKITHPAKYVNSVENPYLPLKVGDQIGWNVDEKNKKGIVILLEYDPSSLQNAYLESKGQVVNATIKKAKAITVADTEGMYTYTNDDLKDFPANAYISLTIGRANFIDLKSGEATYTFLAYTIVTSSYQIKR